MSLIIAMIKTRQGGKAEAGDITNLQKRRLKKLVFYAKEHSPYYKRLYGDISDDFSLSDTSFQVQ